MWRIEIRDNTNGRIPGKLRKTDVSELPELSALRRLDQFAIISRIPSMPTATSHAMCGACRRKAQISDHIKRQEDLRILHGSNVVAFPVQGER